MKPEKQLRTAFWLMTVNAVMAGINCILKIQDGDWLAILAGFTALVSVFAVVMCCKGLRQLKKEQDAEE